MIIEWAETGKPVEVKSVGGNLWLLTQKPDWVDYLEYRFKPEVVKYRSALFKYKSGLAVESACDPDMVEIFHTLDEFVRWIDTEWQEVEV